LGGGLLQGPVQVKFFNACPGEGDKPAKITWSGLVIVHFMFVVINSDGKREWGPTGEARTVALEPRQPITYPIHVKTFPRSPNKNQGDGGV